MDIWYHLKNYESRQNGEMNMDEIWHRVDYYTQPTFSYN